MPPIDRQSFVTRCRFSWASEFRPLKTDVLSRQRDHLDVAHQWGDCGVLRRSPECEQMGDRLHERGTFEGCVSVTA
jgi:hypothetical protein